MKYIVLFLFIISYSITQGKTLICPWQHYHLYLWAQYNQLEQHFKLSQKCYDLILHNHPSTHIYPGYTHYLFQTKQFNHIITLMNQEQSIFQQNLDMQLLLAQTYEQLNQPDKADELFLQLSQQYPHHTEVVYYSVLAYMRHQQHQQALELIDMYLQNSQDIAKKHFLFYFLKTQLYLTLRNIKEAQISIGKCVELQPYFDQGWLLAGLINEMANDLDGAIHSYTTYLSLVEHNPLVEQQIMQLLLKRSTTQSPSKPIINNHIQEARLLFEQKQFDKALHTIEQGLVQKPTSHAHRVVKLEILYALHQTEKIFSLLKQWIEENPTEARWFDILYVLYQTNPTQVVTLLRDVYTLSESLASLYLADIMSKNNHYQEALQHIEVALRNQTNPLIRTKLYHQQALLYYHQKAWDNVLASLEQGRREYQHYPPLLNTLAYYYATRTDNSTKAQELITIALRYEPNNSYYLDTQATIWYKQKKYSDAQQLLLNLIQKTPHDVYIVKHLAKTLYKTGNIMQALQALEHGITLSSNPEQKNKLMQRLEQWKQL